MRFEKVTKEQYLKDAKEDKYHTPMYTYSIEDLMSKSITIQSAFTALQSLSLEEIYEDIKLPTRATQKSAGYDFYAPYDFILSPGETMRISTGIRVILDDDKFLMCAPRSGHGFKARIQLDNTVGIIDADYSDSDNQGHIMLKLTNDSNTSKSIHIKKGEGLVQAIIMKYYTVEDDNSLRQRNGGFGSTNK